MKLYLRALTWCGCLQVAAVACGKFPASVAPENSTLAIGTSKGTVQSTGDSAVVTVDVALEAGGPVPYAAEVVLRSSKGNLCRLAGTKSYCALDSTTGAPSVVLETRTGVAYAILRAGGDTGTTTLTASSGDAKDTMTVQFAP